MTVRTVLLVGNPTAQSGKAEARIERARAAMVARGWKVSVQPTAPGGRTVPEVSRRLDEGDFHLAVYLGGDGTFAEVAKGILGAQVPVPLGMLPSGTANDQGKSFGISSAPEALERNLDVIEDGHLTALDVGRIERLPDGAHDLFFDSVGFGWQAEILERRNRDREAVGKVPLLRDLYRDFAVYAGATATKYLESFVEPTKFAAEIVADGVHHHFPSVLDLVIKATAIYGGQWVLDRNGRPDDGRFELVPFSGRRDWASKALRDLKDLPIWQEDLDLLGLSHTEGFSAAAFDLHLIRPPRPAVQAQLDGEEWVKGERFRVEVTGKKLPLLTPRDFTPPWSR